MFRKDEKDKYHVPFEFSKGARLRPLPPCLPDAWAVHPEHRPLNFVPKGAEKGVGNKCNIFFIHPTTFRGLGENWNADWNNDSVNEITDTWAIKHQASVFVGMGAIYAPRYRQAHLRSFYIDSADSEKSLNLAYSDIKAAFHWFLEREDDGKPIILAGHSQGSYHLIRLMKEFFDGTPLQNRLIAAYIPGMELDPEYFTNIPPLLCPNSTGGYVRWMTVTEGHFPKYYKQTMSNNIVVNPIHFKANLTEYSDYNLHKGTLTRKFKFRYPKSLSARPHEGLLWIKPLHPPLGALIRLKDWHVADYNLFWPNIRENIALRINSFYSNITPSG
ncbi:MAG: hypothetical protein COA49_01850 [Bacteroidetes bacterium]|nr:MAG: hypothetical protein COA49_01850 [Bacteroidota bacterium]